MVGDAQSSKFKVEVEVKVKVKVKVKDQDYNLFELGVLKKGPLGGIMGTRKRV
jgi:hypothetical protein